MMPPKPSIENMKQSYKLSDLIQNLNDVSIQGDSNCIIEGVCTIQQAMPGCITFLTNPLYKKYLPTTMAAAVILLPEDAKYCPVNALISKDPYYTYAKIAQFFDDKPILLAGIHETAVIGKHCDIAPSVHVGAFTVIGDHVKLEEGVLIGPHCVVGDYTEIDKDSHLHAHVTLYHRTKMGKRIVVSSGTVIGSDGFGYANHKGNWHKVPQLGRVVIEDDVEIGANCAIDRGAIGDTIIKKGAKLDNHIQIGHNVHIGENTAMAALVGVSGSTEIGKNCLIGGQTGFAGHIHVTDRVVITGGSGVTGSIREPGIYSSGLIGVEKNREWKKNNARIRRLDKLMDRVKALEIIINEVKERKT
jgi:UDP-3-O-[3-hydroxymyristoyl] glucosamine N-acyltransferase